MSSNDTLVETRKIYAVLAAAGLGTLATQSGTFSGTSSGTNTGDQNLSAYAPLAGPVFTGVVYKAQAAPTAKSAAGTLTIAELLTLMFNTTGASAFTLTLPTGTLTDAGILAGALPANEGFEWRIVNTATAIITLAAGVGHTILGAATTPASSSSRWFTRKSATNTFITYRIG